MTTTQNAGRNGEDGAEAETDPDAEPADADADTGVDGSEPS